MNQPTPKIQTLDQISERKKNVRKELEDQKSIIQEQTKELFYPQPKDTGISSFMDSFNKGLALYDGVMTGIKLMRKVRRFLTKKSRNLK